MRADKSSPPAGGSEEPDAGRRRFREELRQIPMVSHQVYGSCLAPNIGAVPGAAVVFVSARLKAALNGIWEPLLGFSEESLFPDFDGFALAHGVDKPFPAEFNIDP